MLLFFFDNPQEETIAKLKRQFAEELEKIKQQAEETYRTLAEEKSKELHDLEAAKDQQIKQVRPSLQFFVISCMLYHPSRCSYRSFGPCTAPC